MSTNYDDDSTRVIPVVRPPQKTWTDWVKDHKWLILIILALLALALWYFFLRKGARGVDLSKNSNVSTVNGVTVTKARGY